MYISNYFELYLMSDLFSIEKRYILTIKIIKAKFNILNQIFFEIRIERKIFELILSIQLSN